MIPPVAVTPSLHALVIEVWQQVLKIKQYDPAQSWQDAGGDSLGILQLLLKLERRCGCVLSFDMINPEMRVCEIVALIEQGPRVQAAAVPLVHLLPGSLGDEPSLASFRRALQGRMAFNLLDIADLYEPAAVLRDMYQIGRLAALAIERRQPSGPIVLAGYSFGGSVAYEAARSLIKSGREVALLAIFDTKFGVAATGVARTTAQFGAGRGDPCCARRCHGTSLANQSCRGSIDCRGRLNIGSDVICFVSFEKTRCTPGHPLSLMCRRFWR